MSESPLKLFLTEITQTFCKSLPIATHPSGKANYEGAQVWRTQLRSSAELFIIKKLAESRAISLWSMNPGHAEFLVRRKFSSDIAEFLASRHINHQVIIPDVQRKIDSVKVRQELWNTNTLRLGHRMNWKSYPTLATIDEYFVSLTENYGAICKIIEVGTTEERRPIRMVKISNGNPENKAILIVGGQHAREWVAITSAFYIINNITTDFRNQPEYIRNKDWYIIPVANPDGFAYTNTHDRLWRKNRRPFKPCYGVDLNRNFDVNWDTADAIFDNCSNVYSGPRPFSEPETAALRDVILSAKKNFSAMLDIHSYGQLILYPWGAISKPTDDKHLHESVAKGLSAAIFNTTRAYYKFGTPPKILYPVSGTVLDFAYTSNISLSFAIEARETGHHGFLLPPEKIEDTGKDIFSAVRYLAMFIDDERESHGIVNLF